MPLQARNARHIDKQNARGIITQPWQYKSENELKNEEEEEELDPIN
jgi:hypothetical protein